MKCLALVILLAVAARSAPPKEKSLPDFITPCKPKDDKCLKATLEGLRSHFLQGIPEFELPPIDTFHIFNFNQTYGTTTSRMSYVSHLLEIAYVGAGNYTVSKAHVDLDAGRFDLVLEFPHITMATLEHTIAKGYGFDVDGTGRANSVISDLVIDFSLKGKKKPDSRWGWEEDVITVTYGDINLVLDADFKDRQNYEAFLAKFYEKSEVGKVETDRFFKLTFAEFILRIIQIVHEVYPIDVLYDLKK